jgi:hypothetical protein
MPAAFAMLRTLHWVAFGGFSCEVMCTCLIFSGVNGLTREGRVASFNSPAALRHIAARPAADREQALAHRRNPLRRQPIAGQQHGTLAPLDKNGRRDVLLRLDIASLSPSGLVVK